MSEWLRAWYGILNVVPSVRALHQPGVSGRDALLGAVGEAVSALTTEALVRVRSELRLAEAPEPIDRGGSVEVLEVEGATLRVRRWQGPPRADGSGNATVTGVDPHGVGDAVGQCESTGGGEMSRWNRLMPGTAFVFYLLIALEAIIMITPFTAYFYAVYAPVLTRLEARPSTAWLTAFFLPHITYTGDPLLTTLAWLGPALLTAGLGIFVVCAGQVYSAKLLRRGVVSGGLYRRIRHPQYLGLGVAGLGLLLYWPRFIILLLYLSMLFVYSLLARHEEARMEARFGEGYRQYREATWRFLPGAPGGAIFSRLAAWTGGRGWALAVLYVGVLALGTAVAFGARAYSVSRIPMVRYSESISAVSLSPAGGAAIEGAVATAVAHPEVNALLARVHRRADHTLVAYVVPTAYMMQHLIADLGEHEAHHDGGQRSGGGTVVRHLGEMYALKPLRQLREGAGSPARRVIFTEAVTAAGASVPPARALDADVLRFPLFFVELNGDAVKVVMETPRRHSWGTIPVPAF